MPLTSGFGGRGASRRGDSAVVAVLLAAGLWELTVAAFRPGEPSLPALLAFGCAAMYVAGAAAATVGRWAVPAGVVLVASMLSVVGRTTLFTALPHAGPLRYANASAAFFAISATAALALGWSFDNRAFRWTSIALAASLLSVCIAEHAVAATLAGITIPAIGLAVRNRLGPRASVASLVCVGLLAVAAPIGAGIVYRPHDPASR